MNPENDQDRNRPDPGDYGRPPKQPASGPRPQQRFDRERLSNDYDDEPPPRRRPAAAGNTARAGRLTSLLGSDPATRKLVGGAVGIGVVLLLAVGGWSLTGGHHGGIPIIGPPPGPVKDRPADPGGMQIMSGDDGETDMTGNGEAHLAPGPEQPDTKALARQYGVPPGTPAAETPATDAPKADAPAQGGATPDKAPASQAPAIPPEAAAPTDTGQMSPGTALPATVPEKPQDQAAAPAEPPKAAPAKEAPKKEDAPVHHAARPVEKPLPAPGPNPDTVGAPKAAAPAVQKAERSGSGSHEVQLGAFDSEAAARKEWDSLRHQAPALFAGHTPLFEKTTRGDHTFVRLRIGGFEDLKAARAYCVKLHAQSVACTPAQF
ncbi:SPOR domain-containing protein [Gluconobacter sp. Dm-62]|uniref:SPOR domain-containing protein n=1 Tax=Gluconobacter sp. Dm-62 TaxID=2799804 RepID=UPI001B8CB8A5|nr:SPOR domain-containing protein [Gluconobacter sp. Dm-62]MBS1102691.1 SPOR domain-containing protein [Gluconobacter sp. Dm-62]